MNSIPNIIPISDLRQDAADVIKSVNTQDEPVVITQRGRASAVLLGMSSYEEFQKKLEILNLLLRGEQEIQAGVGYDLDDVITDSRKLTQS